MKLKTVSETDYFLSDSVTSGEFVIFSAKKMSSSVETTSEPGSSANSVTSYKDDRETARSKDNQRPLPIDFNADGSVTIGNLGMVSLDVLIAALWGKKREAAMTKETKLNELNGRIHFAISWSKGPWSKGLDKFARKIIEVSLSPEERSAIEADRAEAKRHRASLEGALRMNLAVQTILVNELLRRRQEAVEMIADIDAELAHEWGEEDSEAAEQG